MAAIVTLKVIKVDAHDVAAGVKVGDVFSAVLEFNNGVHYYVIQLENGRHHLLRDQVERVDQSQL